MCSSSNNVWKNTEIRGSGTEGTLDLFEFESVCTLFLFDMDEAASFSYLSDFFLSDYVMRKLSGFCLKHS